MSLHFFLTKWSALYLKIDLGSIVTSKKTKTRKQKTSVSTVPLTPYKISISSSLNISIVSALNWSLRDIMRTTSCIFLFFAFGVTNATEDRVTNGKHIHT